VRDCKWCSETVSDTVRDCLSDGGDGKWYSKETVNGDRKHETNFVSSSNSLSLSLSLNLFQSQ
jgi:hypothetical protein